MKLSLALVCPSLIKPATAREKATQNLEIANVLKLIGDHIAATGARDGQIENGDFSGSFWITG
ncbi:MAG TPA: hypothetical protein VIJ35_19200 [Bradyrhizobium sp.]